MSPSEGVNVDTKQQVMKIMTQHEWITVPARFDLEMVSNQLVDLIERIAEAHAEAGFDRGIAAEQLRTK